MQIREDFCTVNLLDGSINTMIFYLCLVAYLALNAFSKLGFEQSQQGGIFVERVLYSGVDDSGV